MRRCGSDSCRLLSRPQSLQSGVLKLLRILELLRAFAGDFSDSFWQLAETILLHLFLDFPVPARISSPCVHHLLGLLHHKLSVCDTVASNFHQDGLVAEFFPPEILDTP